MNPDDIDPADVSAEELARQCADILGPSSASAQAIAELERRKKDGEDAFIARLGKTWLVVPRAWQANFGPAAF